MQTWHPGAINSNTPCSGVYYALICTCRHAHCLAILCWDRKDSREEANPEALSPATEAGKEEEKKKELVWVLISSKSVSELKGAEKEI